MGIETREGTSHKDLKAFIKFPFALYKDNPFCPHDNFLLCGIRLILFPENDNLILHKGKLYNYSLLKFLKKVVH